MPSRCANSHSNRRSRTASAGPKLKQYSETIDTDQESVEDASLHKSAEQSRERQIGVEISRSARLEFTSGWNSLRNQPSDRSASIPQQRRAWSNAVMLKACNVGRHADGLEHFYTAFFLVSGVACRSESPHAIDDCPLHPTSTPRLAQDGLGLKFDRHTSRVYQVG